MSHSPISSHLLSLCRQSLVSRGLSPTTLKLYLSDIKKFIKNHSLLSELFSPLTYTSYLEMMIKSGASQATLNRTTAALKQLGDVISRSYSVDSPTANLRFTPNSSSSNGTVRPYQNHIKAFTKALTGAGLSKGTIKSYKSDINLYLEWISKQLTSTNIHELLTIFNTQKYLQYLSNIQLANPSTINRKGQSLSRFRQFINSHRPQLVKPDSVQIPPSRENIYYRKPTFSPGNIVSLSLILLLTGSLAVFGYRQLSREQVVLTQAYPSTPVTPNRQISFQGRLENSAGTPINSATNFVFKLWNDPSAGSQLYTSGTCSITPDNDGVFTTQIGDTCGSAIDASVFTENADVYLEVTVAAETLTPRQQIATVAYALNSETIQGFPISATVSALRNTIVPMNQYGEIIIGEQSPRMRAVAGTYSISAPALSLVTNTGTSGNITLAPDGTGQVNVNGNTTSTNFFSVSNAQLTTGSLITGTAANNNTGFYLLNLLSGSSPTSKFSVTDAGNVTLAGDLTISGGNITSATTFDSSLTVSGTLGANGVVNLGDGGDAITINGSSVGIQTTGAGSDITLNAVDQIILTDFTGGGSGCTALETDGSGFLTCGSDGGGTTWWRENLGTLSPVNDTLDLLVGGNASSSAEAGFININSGTPTATVSAGVAGASTLTATGILGTTAFQTLTLGNATTGNIVISPGGVTALTAIGNDLTTADTLTVSGTLTANGVLSLGDNGDIGQINTSDWDIGTGGTMTNIASIDMDGDLTITQADPTISLVDTGGDDYTINVDANAFTIINSSDSRTELTFDGAGGIDLGANNTAKTINIATGTGADTINIGTGGTGVDDINIGGLATSHTDFTGIVNFAGGSTYYVDASGNLNANSGTFAGTLTANATLDANGVVTLGDGGDSITIDGSSVGIQTTGAGSDITLNAVDQIILTDFTGGGSGCTALETDGSGNLICGSDGGGGTTWWRENLGTLSPINDTLDLLVGGSATSSAEAGFININSGTPTATVSAGVAGGSFLTANGYLSTTARQSLTLGNSSTYNTTGNILLNSNGTGYVGIGTATPSVQLDIQGVSTLGSVGSELISTTADRDFSSDTGNWTGTNWSIGSGVATHTAGANNYTLAGLAATSGTTYQVTFTVVTTTAGTIYTQFGGVAGAIIGQETGTTTAHTSSITATGTGGLIIVPSAAWAGTIDNISVKAITFSTPLQTLRNTDGTVGVEFRSGGNTNSSNTFLGTQAGRSTGSGFSSNVGVGYQALWSNIAGDSNTAVGFFAMGRNTDGDFNTAIGDSALANNTEGTRNVAVGRNALAANVIGEGNNAFGNSTLDSNTTGIYNAGFGDSALTAVTTGDLNSAFGASALDSLTTGNNNIGLGYLAGDNLTTGSNNIVIGYDIDLPSATGSNQLNIGNLIFGTGIDGLDSSISSGNIGIATNAPTSFKLQVAGSVGPNADDTYDLGSNTLRWRDLYLGGETIHIGTSTTDEGSLSYNTTTNILTLATDSTAQGNIILAPGGTTALTAASSDLRASDDLRVVDSISLENDWSSLGFNAFWDETDARWEYISTDDASVLYKDGTTGGLQIATTASGTANTPITWTYDVIRILTDGKVGIGAGAPDAKLDSLTTSGEQLRLTYTDGSVYSGFTVNSSGNLTINPTGGSIILDTDDDLIPTLGAGSADLGSAALPWDNLYVSDLDFSAAASSITLKDNTANAFRILEGANVYLDITTTNDSETFTLNLPTGGATLHTANLFNANIAQTINLGTGTAVDTINIGTGGTSADDINIGGLATSHTDFTGVVNFAGGSTYYVNASGNANFLDLIAADTGNPGFTVGNGSIGYAKIGGSTISDNSGNLTLDSDSAAITIAADDTTLTASGLATLTTAASLNMSSTTSLTLGDSSTLYGGDNASGTLTLSSTSNVTQGNIQFFTSSNTLSPTGNLTIAGDLTVNGNDIASASNLLIAAVGYVRIGDTGTPSTFGDDDDDLYVTGDIELDGDLLVDGGELYLTPLTTSASTTEGTIYYDSDVDGLYVYANGAYRRLATGVTSFSANNSSVANGSYVEIAHNTATNDISAMGWFLDTISGLYKNVAEYSHNLIQNLQNQWSDSSYTAFNIDTSGTLRDRIFAYWSMNETSATAGTQVTRNDNYGTSHLTDNRSATSYILSATGKVDNGADLELTNGNYFEKTDSDTLSTGDIDFTVAAWVKLESETAGTTPEVIISKSDSAGTGEYMLYYTGATADDFAFQLYNSSGTTICTATDNTNQSTGTWYYIVAWHDSVGNTCNIKVNNGSTTSTAVSGSPSVPSDTSANLRIGARYTTEQDYFDGVIDEVAFWKKVLSSTEITDLYNSGSGNTFSPRSGFVRTQANLTDVSVTPAIDLGTGADGALSVTSDTNINTANSGSRSCADGGDAVNYSVTALTSTSATLESSPSAGCLNVGDEVLLINLRGTSSLYPNLGNYETLRISGVAGSVVSFNTSKTKYYGDGATDDTNIGLATTNQTVMLQRVPNYTSVTLSNSGTDLTPSAWSLPTGSANNGAGEGGVIFFRATGTVTVASNTTINTNSLGYAGGAGSVSTGGGGTGGDSFCGVGGGAQANGSAGGGGNENNGAGGNGSCGGGGGGALSSGAGGTGSASVGGAGGGGGSRMNGGGGGFGSAGLGGVGYVNGSDGGTNTSGNGGTGGGSGGGGGTYGTANLYKLYFGSGGGGAGYGSTGSAGSGGNGGGIVFIAANNTSVSGNIQSNGGAGGNGAGTSGAGGGGGGGSLRLEGSTLTLGTSLTTTSGGSGGGSGAYGTGGTGGNGRIATYYSSSVSGSTSPASTDTFSGYHTYGVYHSPVIATPNAVTLESLRWEYPTSTPSGLKKIEFQTRTGSSVNPIDGTWEDWRPEANQKASGCASPNCVSVTDGNTHTEWTGTNVTIADGDVTRNIDMFEDEDEATAGNITKGTSSTNGGTAEDTIASTDFSGYDYLTAWVRASQTGSTLKLGFGESAGTEQEETLKIDSADTWQKVYWDLSDIPAAARNAVTKVRFTNLTTASNVFYIDNIQLEKHMVTPSGSAITSTPNNYFQYRIIFTTTNTAYYPSVENIQLLYTDGYKIIQTDTNTVRLYNYTGSTQSMRLEAISFGADLAEWYTVEDPTIGPGDLVALTGILDSYGVPILRKTNSANDPQLIGAISTKAGQTLGLETADRRLLALAGRIPVKIDESSASIQVGDPLTSSATPGLARKAKPGELSFARAAVSWLPGDAPTILVIVNNTIPTSGIELVDAMLQKVGGVWQTVATSTDSLIDSVVAFGKIIATNSEIANLQVDTLSPLASGSAVTVDAPLVIKEQDGGGAYLPELVVEGEIEATTISARTAHLETLEAKNIIADRISAKSIDGLEATIATLSAGPTASLSDDELETITTRLKDRISAITNPATAEDLPIPDPANNQFPTADIAVSNVASDSALIANLDTIFLSAESVEAKSGTLSLQPFGGTINLASGTMIVDSSGAISIKGQLDVTGTLALRPEKDAGLAKLLTIYNESGESVASIDASGSANLASLTTELITIAAAADSTSSGLLSTSTSSNSTAGEAVLFSPETELTIYSSFVKSGSLVYLTPTSNSANKVLYVKSKDTCQPTDSTLTPPSPCIPSFTVAIDTPAKEDISFNWWVIELQN